MAGAMCLNTNANLGNIESFCLNLIEKKGVEHTIKTLLNSSKISLVVGTYYSEGYSNHGREERYWLEYKTNDKNTIIIDINNTNPNLKCIVEIHNFGSDYQKDKRFTDKLDIKKAISYISK